MFYRHFCIVFVLLCFISSGAYADAFKLMNFSEKIDAKIVEVNDDFVQVVIPQEEIGSMSVNSALPARPTGGDDEYSDTVIINVNGREHKVVCQIVKITKEPGGVTLKIPRQKISAIQIAFPGSENDADSNQLGLNEGKDEKKEYSPVDVEKLKEQIMKELMLKFEEKQKLEDESLEEKIKEELTLELEEKRQEREKAYTDANSGSVKGRMLFKGKPLSGCGVKIVMLEKWGWEVLGSLKEGMKFETVTDVNGIYYFEKVLSGGYKLYWKPPHENSWIRKMKMEPDFYVEAGEIHYLPDRETNVRTIN